jgi:hypothetical protein
MKQFMASWKTFVAFLVLSLAQLAVFAQDNPGSGDGNKSTTITTETTSTTTWYTQPWVWIVGAIVLLILIIALVRGNSTESRTTVIKD